MTEEANPKPEVKESEDVKPADSEKAETGAAPKEETPGPTFEEPAKEPAAEAKTEPDPKPEAASPANDSAKPAGPKVDPTEPFKAEIAELKDRLLRLAADMENQRRRQDREMADARQYAVTAFARELLTVADNLARAVAAFPADKRVAGDPVDNVLSGVEVTDRELQRVFEKHGVKRFGVAGEKFDPNRHQAIYEKPDGSVAPGTIAEVVQSGYSIGERVLRPALVAVASAPKAPPAENPPTGDSEKKS